MGTRIFAVLSLGLGIVSAFGQARLPDIPQNHWVFENLQRLKTVGFIPGGHGVFSSGPPPQKRALAIQVTDACANLTNRAAEYEADAAALAHLPAETRVGTLLEKAKSDALLREPVLSVEPALIALLDFFGPEIRAQNLNPADLKHDVRNALTRIARFHIPEQGSALRQFKDVPVGHWAAEATLELRRLGILQGYPDGVFSGEGALQ